MAVLKVVPETCLVDDTYQVIVTGLSRWEKVTLVSRLFESGVRLYAFAHYVSDEDGVVDLTKAASQGGSYEGIEPMGHVWSQRQDPGQSPGRRLAKADVRTPLVTKLYVLRGFVGGEECLELVDKGQALCSTSCDRYYLADGVQRREVREGRLTATLFVPKGTGPFPGVVDLFGTVGGLVEHRAALLASRGIAALALCYFTPGKGEGLISDVDYFEEAVDYILRQPEVFSHHAGIIGVSKGAEMALLLSSLCHKVKACVTINGVDIITLMEHRYKGQSLPWRELSFDVANTEHGVRFDHLYDIPLEEREKYQIPVERGRCEYLLLHGADDKSMPASASRHVAERLKRHGRRNYRLVLYEGAGHLLEPPHSPHFMGTYHAMFGKMAYWGGTPKEHSRAQEAAWKEILYFFKDALTPQAAKSGPSSSQRSGRHSQL